MRSARLHGLAPPPRMISVHELTKRLPANGRATVAVDRLSFWIAAGESAS